MYAAPHFALNKIKRVVQPCALVVGAHVCANHTPILIFRRVRRDFKSGEQKRRSRGIRTKSGEKSSRWPKPGRPAYVFHQNRQNNSPGIDYIKPAHLQKGHGDWPQVQAGRPSLGRPAPLVSFPPRFFVWCWFEP